MGSEGSSGTLGDIRRSLPAVEALVVHSGGEQRRAVVQALERAGVQTTESENGLSGWQRFQRERPDLVVAALDLPGLGGLELLSRIRACSRVSVMLATDTENVRLAVEAMKRGADDVVLLPDGLGSLYEYAVGLQGAALMAMRVEREVSGSCAAMQVARERVIALSTLDVPVLIRGERGTGRDLVARVLHGLRFGRAEGLSLVGGESGALDGRAGARGAVYLDEIGGFSRREQGRWARYAIECEKGEGEGRGRVIASTSENIEQMVRDGTFDAGLAQVLMRFTIDLPALRERVKDIPMLVESLAERIARRMGRTSVVFSRRALRELQSATWLGNVRELAGTVEKLVAFAPRGRIDVAQVKAVLREAPTSVSSSRLARERAQEEELVKLIDETGGNLAEIGRRINMSRGAVIYRAQKFGLLPKPR
jgi:DNA-binding NtrC family response regulator